MQVNNIEDETRKIKKLRVSSDLVVQLILMGRVSYEEAEKLISNTRNLAESLFPGKGQVFDLIYMPKFRRALREAGYFKDFELRAVN